MTWAIMNDGYIEIQTMVYGYDCSGYDLLDHTILVDYKITNPLATHF